MSGVAAADFHARVLPLPRPLREFISRRITKAFSEGRPRVSVREGAARGDARERPVEASRRRRPVRRDRPQPRIDDRVRSALEPVAATRSRWTCSSRSARRWASRKFRTSSKVITGQKKGLAVPRVVKRWINVADPLDPVCADKRLASDYAPTNGVGVEDFLRWNRDSPRDPHSGSGYLRLAGGARPRARRDRPRAVPADRAVHDRARSRQRHGGRRRGGASSRADRAARPVGDGRIAASGRSPRRRRRLDRWRAAQDEAGVDARGRRSRGARRAMSRRA